jgi:protein-L-isoaspartate(D-aspartate) O-methyltransferase
MNLEQARFNMIEQQIRTWEVLDQDVLDLLYAVRREDFVPAAYRALAFSDLELPLRPEPRPGEHMLQPKVEARVLQEVAPRKHESALEVGTGSGYFAALLAARSQRVHTVEIDPEIHALGEQNLRRAGIANVRAELGDAALGWSAHAPYDVIVLTGSTPVLPHSLLEQLKPGGRLFAVVGDPPVMEARLVRCLEPGEYQTLDLFETCLAPLRNAPEPRRFTF